MIASIVGMFAVVLEFLLLWPVFISLILAGILFEHFEARGWAIFTAIVATVVAFFKFDIPVEYLLQGAIAYMVIGVVWSFWRYKRYVDKAVQNIQDEIKRWKDYEKERFMEKYKPQNNIDLITTWIIIWPFSAIDNIIGDLITVVESLVRTAFRKVYDYIFTSSVSTLPALQEREKHEETEDLIC